MKYFQYTRQRLDRVMILDEWVKRVVVKQLEEKGCGTGLDWTVSIVDLLKELGCPPDLMHYSAKMNT